MRLKSVIPATAAVLLASCSSLTQACTLIACQDGLEVRFAQAPAGAYRVEAIVEGAAPQAFDCADPALCPGAFFADLRAERVTLRVTTAAGTHTQEFAPRYETLYPNGRDCGGRCRQAAVTVQM